MRAQKNYQKMLEATIAGLKEQNRVPTLLLHSCCAPCSSYCLEYLSQYFHITVDYYNPNIYPEEEYHMRVQEQQRLIREPMIRSVFMRWRAEWRRKRRAANAASGAMSCA